MTNHLIVL